MKKIFLFLAFIGMLNVVSANTLDNLLTSKPLGIQQDDKTKKDSSTHHSCSKHDKAKCDMKKGSHKDCSKGEKGKCCKMKKDSIAH
jgi:hypothetical protein